MYLSTCDLRVVLSEPDVVKRCKVIILFCNYSLAIIIIIIDDTPKASRLCVCTYKWIVCYRRRRRRDAFHSTLTRSDTTHTHTHSYAHATKLRHSTISRARVISRGDPVAAAAATTCLWACDVIIIMSRTGHRSTWSLVIAYTHTLAANLQAKNKNNNSRQLKSQRKNFNRYLKNWQTSG